MADFETSYKRLKKGEGGYVNIKEDRGGETYMGISRNNYPNHPIFHIIDELKGEGIVLPKEINKRLDNNAQVQSLIKDFYKVEYWDKMKLDDVAYQDFACNMLLLGVNAGIKRAVKVGQEACGIGIDGIYGNNTAVAFKKARQEETKAYTDIEIRYYRSLVKKDKQMEKFLNGWEIRAREV